jgi:hypothetical protein
VAVSNRQGTTLRSKNDHKVCPGDLMVEALIAKLQDLDIEQADPALWDKLSQLVTTTQSTLQKASLHLLSGSDKRDMPVPSNHGPNSHSSDSSLSHRGDSLSTQARGTPLFSNSSTPLMSAPAKKHPAFPFIPVDLGGGKPSETGALLPK